MNIADSRLSLDASTSPGRSCDSASLDEALPEDNPRSRYEEACRRLDETVSAAAARGEDTSIVYSGLYGVLRRPAEVVDDALAMERELLAG